MAGTRQHFLPRFLTKGFSSKIHKNECYTWVFTINDTPYEPNLRNIGLEKYFYGNPGESTVDEIISQKEIVYSEQLDKLREFDSSCSLDDSFPPEFITHLVVRAKHIRESFQEAGTAIINVVRKKLDDEEKFHQMLSNLIENQPELIEKSLSEEFDKKLPPGFPQHQKDMLIQSAKSSIPQMLPNFAIEGHALFSQLFLKMIDEIPNIAKGAHVKALSKSVAPKEFIKRFDEFNWSLKVTDKPAFILGDIGPIGRYEPSLHFKPLPFAKGELYQIFLPISDRHIIVGNSNKNLPIPEIDELNKASASLSQYYFISSNKGEIEIELSRIISSESSNISDADILDVENKVDSEWFGVDKK